MTTDCRPGITDPTNLLQKTYEEQRKCRMQDAIDDYLQDDKVSSRQAYEEMLSCIDDVIQYHQKEYVKARELYSLMMGHREVDFMDDPELAAKWQYDKIPGRY